LDEELMANILLAARTAHLTNYGKRMVAESMYAKGKAFLGAAILLRHKNGNEYVVLYLICQGIEISLKGLLLVAGYDKYKPQLKKLGHNLVKIVEAISQVSGIKPLRQSVRAELKSLSKLYSTHLLRYGSGYDILVNPTTISSNRVLHRMVAVLRIVECRGLVGKGWGRKG
jgi:HEPN domain-containing protein